MLAASRSSAVREFPRVWESLWMRVKEIRIERKNYFCFVEAVMCLDKFAENLLHALMNVVARDRFILMALRFRKSAEQIAKLSGKGGRGDCLGEKTQSGSFLR